MNTHHYIAQGDNEPSFICTPRDGNGAVLRTLPGGTTAQFRMKRGSTLKVNHLAVLFTETDAVGPFYRVRYDWDTTAGDTDTPGTYAAEVELIWPGQTTGETFPNHGYAYVHVKRGLG